MSFISNLKKLTSTNRGKLPVYYLNLYFNHVPIQIDIPLQLEIRKLYRPNVQNDDILLFLLLLSDTAKAPAEQKPLELEKLGVNYWPVLSVTPVNPIDIFITQPLEAKCETEESIDSGYGSENDVYSISCNMVMY